MKIKKRIKNYFTEKPKQDFWFWAFVTLLFFKYATPYMILMLVPLQVGLIAPDTEINYQNISMNIANNLIQPLEKLNNVGKNLAIEKPIISKVLFYVLSYFIYIIWFAMFILIINLFRYGIFWIIRNKRRLKK